MGDLNRVSLTPECNVIAHFKENKFTKKENIKLTAKDHLDK